MINLETKFTNRTLNQNQTNRNNIDPVGLLKKTGVLPDNETTIARKKAQNTLLSVFLHGSFTA